MVMSKKIIALLFICLGMLVHTKVDAQYSDTIRIVELDSIIANSPESINMFAYLSPFVDPQIIYCQLFWASDRFKTKELKHNNPFHLMSPNGKLRRFTSIDDAIERMVLAMADYDMNTQSYTDYLEKKAKSNWTPRMSERLLEIYRKLYGKPYNHEKQLFDYKYTPAPLRFAKNDSIGHSKYKPYDMNFQITRKDKNLVQADNFLGPLAVLAKRVDTKMLFVQTLWATNHFDPKLVSQSNIFQILDDGFRIAKYDNIEDALADYLVRILDYDVRQESYLDYLERRSDKQWTKEMSKKLRSLYRELYHQEYDESVFPGYKPKERKTRTKTSYSRTRL